MSYRNIDDAHSRRKRRQEEYKQFEFSGEQLPQDRQPDRPVSSAQQAGIAGGLKYLQDLRDGRLLRVVRPGPEQMRAAIGGRSEEETRLPPADVSANLRFFELVGAERGAIGFVPGLGTADPNVRISHDSLVVAVDWPDPPGTVGSPVYMFYMVHEMLGSLPPGTAATLTAEDIARERSPRYKLAILHGQTNRPPTGPVARENGEWGYYREGDDAAAGGFYVYTVSGNPPVVRINFAENPRFAGTNAEGAVVRAEYAARIPIASANAEVARNRYVAAVQAPKTLTVLETHPVNSADADAAFGGFSGAMGYSKNSGTFGGRIWFKNERKQWLYINAV